MRTPEVSGTVELSEAAIFLRQWGPSDGEPVLALHQLGIAGSSLHLAEFGRKSGWANPFAVLAVMKPDCPVVWSTTLVTRPATVS